MSGLKKLRESVGVKMTLQEVIKTNKPFKRADWLKWVVRDHSSGIQTHFILHGANSSVHFSEDDLLAEDWEVEADEGCVKVSKVEVIEAWHKANRLYKDGERLNYFLKLLNLGGLNED